MILLAIFAFFCWFFLSIPVGGIQIEIARRAFNGYLRTALAIVLGSTFADLLYGAVALFGVFRFLAKASVRPWFLLVGALLMTLLGIFSIRNYKKPHSHKPRSAFLQKKRFAFVSGFLLAASNPLMIVGWLTVAEFSRRFGLMPTHPVFKYLLVLLIFGTLGVETYQSLVAITLFRLRHFVPEQKMRFTSLIFGIILVIIGIYFLIESILAFSGHKNLDIEGVISAAYLVFHHFT